MSLGERMTQVLQQNLNFYFFQLFCKSCHLAHVVDMKALWTVKAGELAAEDQRLSLLKEESKVI